MIQPTAPSERFFYPDLSSVSERLINEKIQVNNKFNSNINIIKDIRNYYDKLNPITILRSKVDIKIILT